MTAEVVGDFYAKNFATLLLIKESFTQPLFEAEAFQDTQDTYLHFARGPCVSTSRAATRSRKGLRSSFPEEDFCHFWLLYLGDLANWSII